MPGRRLGGPSYLYCIVAVPFKIHTSTWCNGTWYTNKQNVLCRCVFQSFSFCWPSVRLSVSFRPQRRSSDRSIASFFFIQFILFHVAISQFRAPLRCVSFAICDRIFPPLAFVDFGSLAAAVKCPTPERFIVGKETRSIFQSNNEVRCSNPFHRPDGIGSSCQVRICLCLPPPSSNFWKQSSNACIFVIVVFRLHSPRHIPIGHQGGGH